MIESIIITPQILPSNSSPVTFTTDQIRTNSTKCDGWLCRTEGSPLYKITKGGIYEINLTSHVTSATAGIVALGLYRDGVLDPSTVVAQTLAAAGDNTELSINKTIKVCCKSNENISIGAVPSVISTAALVATDTVAPTILNANLSITRIC